MNNIATQRGVLAAMISRMTESQLNELIKSARSIESAPPTDSRTIDANCSLRDYLNLVLVPKRGISATGAVKVYRSAVKAFGEMLIRRAKLSDLTIDNMIQFGKTIRNDLTLKRANEFQNAIKVCWRTAAKSGIIPWSDNRASRRLTHLLPFIEVPHHRAVLEKMILQMRADLGRKVIASDLTDEAIDRYGSRTERTTKENVRWMMIVAELRKLAGDGTGPEPEPIDPAEDARQLIVYQPLVMDARINRANDKQVAAPKQAKRLIETTPLPISLDNQNPDMNTALMDVLVDLLLERPLSRDTEGQYRHSINLYSRWLGRDATICDLNLPNLNRWIAWLGEGRSGTTVRNLRVGITRVWNYLADCGRVDTYDSKRLRKPQVTKRSVWAWSLDDVRTLAQAAREIEGRLQCGIDARDLVGALIWVGYDTGVRPIDLRHLRWEDIDLTTGAITITQHKTRNPHRALLSGDALQAIELIRKPTRERVFPLTKGGVRRWELKLFEIAERNGFVRRKGQGLGTLRKTHATQIYLKADADSVAESLGHVGGTRTAWASYIDHRARRAGQLPPRPSN